MMNTGENGTLQYTEEGVNSSIVALFFVLCRDLPDERLYSMMNKHMEKSVNKSECITDLFVIAMQTRDCRGGKGERTLSYKMFIHLYKFYPAAVRQLFGLFGEYGYYKDLFQMSKLAATILLPCDARSFTSGIIEIIVEQIKKDTSILDGHVGSASIDAQISMCAKYCPREGKHFTSDKVLFSGMVNALFPDTPTTNKKQYRQLISRLTRAINIPETKMCEKRFKEIDFAKMPSRCAKKFSKAFLNEKIDHKKVSKFGLGGTRITGNNETGNNETGNRYPQDVDRVLCRQHMLDAAKKCELKGGQLDPHELIEPIYSNFNQHKLSDAQLEVINAQWIHMRKQMQQVLNANETLSKPLRLIPLSDVSGSMNGIPMIVSIALGILVSEINHPAFRDRVLTFETDSKWVNLSDLTTISQKVERLRHAGWGGRTNLNSALHKICEVARVNRLSMEDIPDLIVFSDMQFDNADNNFKSQLDYIRDMFSDLGIQISGIPYPVPKIIFWNLRGNTWGFPAQSTSDNVQMLSGYSHSMLKHVIEGKPFPALDEYVLTPYQTLRKVLDDTRYDPVRTILAQSLDLC